MIMAIPGIIGYYFGKKYTSNPVSPQVFLAQPDRQDPDHIRCRFLSIHNYCSLSSNKGVFFTNVCDNKWNQVTCQYYKRKINSEKSSLSYQQGDLIDEIQ